MDFCMYPASTTCFPILLFCAEHDVGPEPRAL